MTYSVIDSAKLPLDNTNFVLPLLNNSTLCDTGKSLDEKLSGKITQLIKDFDVKSELGSATFFALGDKEVKSITLVGLPEEKELSNKALTKLCSGLASALKSNKISNAAICFEQAFDTKNYGKFVNNSIIAISNSTYVFDEYKSKKAPQTEVSINFASSDKNAKELERQVVVAQAQAKGMKLTKDLGNQPGNVCTPTYLAKKADELVQSCDKMSLKILEEKDMEALNMGAFLSVSKGSSEPGKMIIIEYKGTDDSVAPNILVGKGITFDTGGISLKPGAQMDEMKYDMCGAASVLGTLTAIAELQPKSNIIGIIAAAENMPAGHASKPGDIVTTSSGQTVEILNTDAEGRLVLCDALTYAERYNPASVIDIATLTGACIIALGHCTSAIMSNDEELAQEILKCGQEANDQAWQLPIWDDYQEQLDSPFADMQNIGGKGAGSITAACFLSRYTKKYKWAHLDIAGTAWVSGGKDKGATGRPVPLLLNYLLNQSA